MQGVHLRKYGVQTTIDFDLYEVDGVDLRVDAVHASGDTKVMKDEGAEANTTNGFTDEGQGYSIVLTATEMQAARIVLYIVDQATKVWLDKTIVIETYGNASAMHAADLSDSVRLGLTALPNAAADAPGGLPISDAGGLDLDTKLAATNEVTAARMATLTDWIDGGRLDLILDIIAADVVNLDGAAMRGTDGAVTTKTGYSLSTAGILAIWHQALSAISTAGSVGKLIKDEVTSARMATLSDWIDGGRLDLLIDTIVTAAQAQGEPAQGAPPVSADIGVKIAWLYKIMRNKATTTGSTISLYDDAGTTVDAKITHSDDGTTYTKGEIASGP